ncbi:MAG: hypothetical protein AAB510_00085 [Patescibacteria group bacterium]
MFKIIKIFLNTIPIIFMVFLIPIVEDDYLLTGIYIAIIIALFSFKKERKEILIFTLGFFSMIFFEYIFISTGVETFLRNSLFGIMPLWLPFLWGYGFVVIKRSTYLLN